LEEAHRRAYEQTCCDLPVTPERQQKQVEAVQAELEKMKMDESLSTTEPSKEIPELKEAKKETHESKEDEKETPAAPNEVEHRTRSPKLFRRLRRGSEDEQDNVGVTREAPHFTLFGRRRRDAQLAS
jgi:hypothetical protein